MKVVLLYTRQQEEARKELAVHHGRVIQQLTDYLLITELPDTLDVNQLHYVDERLPATLDPTNRLMADAWLRTMQKSNDAKMVPSPYEGLRWDARGHLPPGHSSNWEFISLGRKKIKRTTGTPTSLYLIGSVAVGIVLVSGPGALAFSEEEKQNALSEVQTAFQFLATAEPRAQVSFHFDFHDITVNASPDSGSPSSIEEAEAPWRNEALVQMGYSGSIIGSQQYVTALRNQAAMNWGYVIYLTKYPLAYYAYATNERVVINYFNGTWQTYQLNRVLAHETCHIFGAADEYGSCDCNSKHGQLQVVNGNCFRCAAIAQHCIMLENSPYLCSWTRKQLGWTDPLLP